MNKELQLVSFEQAKRLKEVGFNWEVNKYYDHEFYFDTPPFKNNDSNCFYAVPTVSLALKWFRDVKKKVCAIRAWSNLKYGWEYCYQDNHWHTSMFNEYDDYGAAESALLDELLTLKNVLTGKVQKEPTLT